MSTKYKQLSNPPIKKPGSVSDEQWSKAVELYNTSKAMGDAYPELTVAQAALETGWFKSPSGTYNYFGQKAGKNQPSVTLTTKEQGAKGLYSTKASFRNYDSLEESIGDRLKKWGSKYKDAKNVGEALDIIVKNGYATATNYKTSVGSILNSISSNGKVQSQPTTTEVATAQVYDKPVAEQYIPSSAPANLQTSTTPYVEPAKETAEVQQAKQEINEKSFVQELGQLISQQPQAQVEQQPEIQIDPSAYNYINEEEY